VFLDLVFGNRGHASCHHETAGRQAHLVLSEKLVMPENPTGGRYPHTRIIAASWPPIHVPEEIFVFNLSGSDEAQPLAVICKAAPGKRRR
jgi:hypothetical protein